MWGWISRSRSGLRKSKTTFGMIADAAGKSACATLDEDGGDVDAGAVAFDDYDAGFGDVVELAVLLEVVADGGIGWDAHVLVQNRAADCGAAADVAVVENHAVVHGGAGVHFDAANEDGSFDASAGKD